MKRKSLLRQAYERLQSMAAYGNSKHTDKRSNGGKPYMDKIYSYSTMKNYLAVAAQFTAWTKKMHGCRYLEETRAYVEEYLRTRMEAGKSAWTVRRDAAALGKLFQCATTELGVTLPVRRRVAIVQHRGNKAVGHFSESKHQYLADLGRGSGLRRREIAALCPSDVAVGNDDSVVVHVRNGKGGKERYVNVLAEYAQRIAELARQAEAAGQRAVIPHIPKYAPVHEWRREYAVALYTRTARDVSQLPKKALYICRKDMAGQAYDRRAMGIVSKALGHNRLDVIAASYLR